MQHSLLSFITCILYSSLHISESHHHHRGYYGTEHTHTHTLYLDRDRGVDSGNSGCSGRLWGGLGGAIKLIPQCSYLFSHLQQPAHLRVPVNYWTVANVTSLVEEGRDRGRGRGEYQDITLRHLSVALAIADNNNIEDSSSVSVKSASDFCPEDYDIMWLKYWRVASLNNNNYLYKKAPQVGAVLSALHAQSHADTNLNTMVPLQIDIFAG